MSTLFQATLDLAYLITDVIEGAATGGTSTTLIDTNWPRQQTDGTKPADDTYNQGTVWFTGGTYDGNSRVISDWAQSSSTVTWTTALAGAISAGDTYAAINKDFPRDVLRRCVNLALKELPNPLSRDVTKTSVANEETVSLPAGVYNVVDLWLSSKTSGDDMGYKRILPGRWREEQSSIGTNVIRFYGGAQPRATGYTYAIFYEVPPTEIAADASTISDYIHPQLLAWTAAVHALRWKIRRTRGENRFKEDIAYALRERDKAKKNYYKMIPTRDRPPQLSTFGISGSSLLDPSYEVGKVVL